VSFGATHQPIVKMGISKNGNFVQGEVTITDNKESAYTHIPSNSTSILNSKRAYGMVSQSVDYTNHNKKNSVMSSVAKLESIKKEFQPSRVFDHGSPN